MRFPAEWGEGQGGCIYRRPSLFSSGERVICVWVSEGMSECLLPAGVDLHVWVSEILALVADEFWGKFTALGWDVLLLLYGQCQLPARKISTGNQFKFTFSLSLFSKHFCFFNGLRKGPGRGICVAPTSIWPFGRLHLGTLGISWNHVNSSLTMQGAKDLKSRLIYGSLGDAKHDELLSLYSWYWDLVRCRCIEMTPGSVIFNTLR